MLIQFSTRAIAFFCKRGIARPPSLVDQTAKRGGLNLLDVFVYFFSHIATLTIIM